MKNLHAIVCAANAIAPSVAIVGATHIRLEIGTSEVRRIVPVNDNPEGRLIEWVREQLGDELAKASAEALKASQREQEIRLALASLREVTP